MGFCFPQDRARGVVLERHMSVKAAAKCSGYNEQYLRRLLRVGRLQGVKIGQVWLIRLASLEAHLQKSQAVQDRRFGPQGIPVDLAQAVVP